MLVFQDLHSSTLNLSSPIAKIADFGFASIPGIAGTLKGSPDYISSEMADIILKLRQIDPAEKGEFEAELVKQMDCFSADRWALGIVLYGIITQTFPFSRDDERYLDRKFLMSVKQAETPRHKEFETDLDGWDLINKLLTRNPKSRATFETIKTHPWLADAYAASEFKEDLKTVSFEMDRNVEPSEYKPLIENENQGWSQYFCFASCLEERKAKKF